MSDVLACKLQAMERSDVLACKLQAMERSDVLACERASNGTERCAGMRECNQWNIRQTKDKAHKDACALTC